MAKTKVTITGLGKDFTRRQIATVTILADRQLEEMARKTEIVIQDIIKLLIERDGSTGNLASSFQTIKIIGGWGVGDIGFLNNNAKQWYWQNFGIAQSGRKIPPPTRGRFNSGNPAPDPSGGRSRWGSSSNGDFFMTPKKPIEAKQYIEKTIAQIPGIISSVLRRG